jgi:phospholipase C
VFDHTSVLRFIEARFGVKETNISPFRRAVCGDLTSAFNFATPNGEALPSLMGRQNRGQADQLRQDQQALAAGAAAARSAAAAPATGTRPSRALPYELHTSARADAVGGKVQLLFSNTGKAAAVFHVYDKLQPRAQAAPLHGGAWQGAGRRWTPAAGDNGVYDLWVLGPNGFHRHFKGNLDTLRAGDAPSPEVRVCYDVANGNVYLSMRNDGKTACRFSIRAKAYRRRRPVDVPRGGGASAEQHWDACDSGQWYDFAVTCDADPAYHRRFAGRVETGKHTVSDPAMGLPEL